MDLVFSACQRRIFINHLSSNILEIGQQMDRNFDLWSFHYPKLKVYLLIYQMF